MEKLVIALTIFISFSICEKWEQETTPWADWNQRISQSQMLFSSQPPSSWFLMPNIANGYIGTIILSQSIYAAGVYANTNAHFWQYGINSQRASIPSTVVVQVANKTSYSGFALAVVFQRVILSETNTLIELRWYAHRANRSLLIFEIEVNNVMNSEISISLDVTNSSASGDINFAYVTPPYVSNCWAMEGDIVKPETPYAEIVKTAVVVTTIPNLLQVAANTNRTFVFVTAIRSTLDSDDPLSDAALDLKNAVDSQSELLSTHIDSWSTIWNSRIEVIGNPDLAVKINATLYYVISSIRGDWPWPAAPGGIPSNVYSGHAFWDTDMWIVPSVMIFHPDLGKAESLYRFNRREEAAKCASQNGYNGYLYPFETAFTGHEVDTFPFGNEMEQHSSMDFGVFLKKYWDLTHDSEWLSDVGSDLAVGLSTWIQSKVVSNSDGSYSIEHVVPPDEYAIGEFLDGVTNSVFMNYATILTLNFSIEACSIVPHPNCSVTTWRQIQENLVILFDNENQRHIEYEGFPDGNIWFDYKVKQADVTLLNYPLDIPMSQQVRLNDLSFYEPYYDPNGPAMTYSMDTVAWLDAQNIDKANQIFTQNASVYIQPPFAVWTETPNPNYHPNDKGCYNFITGAGGWIQGVVNGYVGVRIRSDALYFNPRFPQDVTWMAVRGIYYIGSRLDVSYDDQSVTVTLTEEGASQLFIVSKSVQKLTLDQPVSFPISEFHISENPN